MSQRLLLLLLSFAAAAGRFVCVGFSSDGTECKYSNFKSVHNLLAFRNKNVYSVTTKATAISFVICWMLKIIPDRHLDGILVNFAHQTLTHKSPHSSINDTTVRKRNALVLGVQNRFSISRSQSASDRNETSHMYESSERQWEVSVGCVENLNASINLRQVSSNWVRRNQDVIYQYYVWVKRTLALNEATHRRLHCRIDSLVARNPLDPASIDVTHALSHTRRFTLYEWIWMSTS